MSRRLLSPMPEGIVTRSWAHPRDAGGFACQWRAEVVAARKLGEHVGPRLLEVRYERLVAEPEHTLSTICGHVGLRYDAGMLDYAGSVDVTHQPHQQSLTRAPTPGLRDWRTGMRAEDARAFEEVAGDVIAQLGYPTSAHPTLRGRLRRASYAARIRAWNAAAWSVHVSPLWRRRHRRL